MTTRDEALRAELKEAILRDIPSPTEAEKNGANRKVGKIIDLAINLLQFGGSNAANKVYPFFIEQARDKVTQKLSMINLASHFLARALYNCESTIAEQGDRALELYAECQSKIGYVLIAEPLVQVSANGAQRIGTVRGGTRGGHQQGAGSTP